MTKAIPQPLRAAMPVTLQELKIWDPGEIKWELDRPNGCKLTFLQGDTNTLGAAFTYAFFMPDGVWFPAHAHPSDSRIVVVKGTLLLGEGMKIDKAAARAIDHHRVRRPALGYHFRGRLRAIRDAALKTSQVQYLV